MSGHNSRSGSYRRDDFDRSIRPDSRDTQRSRRGTSSRDQPTPRPLPDTPRSRAEPGMRERSRSPSTTRTQQFPQGVRDRSYGSHRRNTPLEHIPAVSETLPSEVGIPSSGRKLDLAATVLRGTSGQPCRVAVNHFPIQSLPMIEVSYLMKLNLKVVTTNVAYYRCSVTKSACVCRKIVSVEALRKCLHNRWLGHWPRLRISWERTSSSTRPWAGPISESCL
jgi:hypothetical protein